jgi:hypothetical protein
VPNTAHIPQFKLCQLWSRPYTKHLKLRVSEAPYSAVDSCAVIVDITTIRCSSYCKIGAKYSAHHSSFRYVTCGPGHIQCNCSSADSGFKIQLNVSALLLEISRQFNARYTSNLVLNTTHVLLFMLSDLWSWTYRM